MKIQERLTTTVHRQKTIFIVDYSDLAYDDLAELMEMSRKRIVTTNQKDLLLLEIVRNVKVNGDTSSSLQKYAREIKPYVKKYAVVGVVGATKIFAKTLKLLNIITIQPCDSEEEALEYLTKHKTTDLLAN